MTSFPEPREMSSGCPEGFGDCDEATSGCETALDQDAHCGACFRACLAPTDGAGESGCTSERMCVPLVLDDTVEHAWQVLVDDEYVYWTEFERGRLRRAPKEGGGAVSPPLKDDGGKAWFAAMSGDDIFVSTRDAGDILRVKKDGSAPPATVVSVRYDNDGSGGGAPGSQKVHGVALHPQGGDDDSLLFFGTSNDQDDKPPPPYVYRIRWSVVEDEIVNEDASTDAPANSVVARPADDIREPWAFARDGAFVYWTDRGNGNVYRASSAYNAGPVQTIAGSNEQIGWIVARNAGLPDEAVHFTWAVADNGINSGGLRRQIGGPSKPIEDRWLGERSREVVASSDHLYWITDPCSGGGRVLRLGLEDPLDAPPLVLYRAEPGQRIQGLAVDEDAVYFAIAPLVPDVCDSVGPGTGRLLKVAK